MPPCSGWNQRARSESRFEVRQGRRFDSAGQAEESIEEIDGGPTQRTGRAGAFGREVAEDPVPIGPQRLIEPRDDRSQSFGGEQIQETVSHDEVETLVRPKSVDRSRPKFD